MRLLVDTQVVLWTLLGSSRLSQRHSRAIERAESVAVSAVSIAEVSIKSALGKLPVFDDLADTVAGYGWLNAPFRADHAERLRLLPAIHGDPFDRMLICQAQTDGLTLVTADERILQYDVALLGP